jgi:integrase
MARALPQRYPEPYRVSKMAKPLTPIAIANLKPRAKRYEVSDGGCQGLRVVVFPSKRKSFIVRYRFRGLQRKLTLGSCLIESNGEGEPTESPELGTPLSLAAARQLAATALRQAKSGNDPATAKARQREEERAAESDTLVAIAAEYLRRKPAGRSDSQLRSDLDLLGTSVLGRLPVAEIRRGQFTRQLDHIADERGPTRADRVLASLRRMLSWHAARSDFISPLGRGGRRTSTKERARTRVLSDPELKAVVATAERRKDDPFAAFVLFILHTATRRSEAAGLRRSELTPDGTVWIIPAQRYKSNRDTLIPLSARAQQILAAMPVLPGDYVFSATDGRQPVGGLTDRKKKFDAACGVENYTVHDLRRTARTLLSRCGVRPDIAEQCLGHALTGVRATYDRHAFESEKAEAFEALAALIETIVRPPTDTVVPISRAKSVRRK